MPGIDAREPERTEIDPECAAQDVTDEALSEALTAMEQDEDDYAYRMSMWAFSRNRVGRGSAARKGHA